jgi:hypothetical protein
MRVAIRASVAITCLIISATAWAQNWSDYKPASVSKAWSEATIVKGTDYTVETLNVKYVIEATYRGEHREIGPARLELVRRWVKALRHPTEFAQMFEHEISIQSGQETYWLPLQNTLVEPFAQEATPGSRLRLYIMYIGAVKSDRLFVINRFQVLPK